MGVRRIDAAEAEAAVLDGDTEGLNAGQKSKGAGVATNPVR